MMRRTVRPVLLIRQMRMKPCVSFSTCASGLLASGITLRFDATITATMTIYSQTSRSTENARFGRSRRENSIMSTLLEDWKAHCVTIIEAAERILRADVTITEKGFADPKFIALALLIRTMSNLKGAMILHRRGRGRKLRPRHSIVSGWACPL